MLSATYLCRIDSRMYAVFPAFFKYFAQKIRLQHTLAAGKGCAPTGIIITAIAFYSLSRKSSKAIFAIDNILFNVPFATSECFGIITVKSLQRYLT